ncbi:LolA-like protein [Edaphobacter bradus]|uniref:hypothetical protein n=1 Tax=Edaphobacter bradus TaxID=2259016 RepID=UPI0021E0B867|nr:hypothetical protein [Edaphobacter bradus]
MRHLAGGLVLAGAVCFVGLRGARAEEPVAPTADEIVTRMMAKNAERQAELESYTSERRYRVEYKGTGGEHHAEIVVRAEYLGSGQMGAGQKRLTVVEESGSKMICERVLRKMVESEQEASEKANRMQMMLSPENYNIELVGQEPVDGVRAWVLQVSPKVASTFTYRGRVWVSEDDYAVMRVQGEPAKSPSWWISWASFDWRYERHGEFWLPEKSVAASHVRIGGDARLMIEYGTYQVIAKGEKRATTTTAQLIGAGFNQ